MKVSRRTQADRTANTRAALIRAGRKLFAEHGFAGVGTEAIVREASVSRGALYHHYADKTDLFEAVLADIEAEVCEQVATAALADENADFVEIMIRAFGVWLDACERPEVRRIVLVDGTSVLGWERWREICQQYMLGLIEGVLAQGMAAGTLQPLPSRPLAHLLLAVADEAALYVATAGDGQHARDEIVRIVRPMLGSLIARAD